MAHFPRVSICDDGRSGSASALGKKGIINKNVVNVQVGKGNSANWGGGDGGGGGGPGGPGTEPPIITPGAYFEILNGMGVVGTPIGSFNMTIQGPFNRVNDTIVAS